MAETTPPTQGFMHARTYVESMAAQPVSTSLEEPVKSAYLPPYGLQGQELSSHLLWHRRVELAEFTLTCDKGLRCIHVYNVPKEQLKSGGEGTSLSVLGVQENGYLGFVLQSDFLDSADTRLKVTFSAVFRQGGVLKRFSQTQQVRVFRPDLQFGELPDRIRVGFSKEGGPPALSSKISLLNRGIGTALVFVAPQAPDSAPLVDYFEEKGERERYVSVLTERMDGLKKEYAQHAEILDKWKLMLHSLSKLSDKAPDEQTLGELERLTEEMKRVEKGDPDFIEDLGGAFGDALLATFALDLKFIAWVETLEAAREQQVTLANPWTSIPIKSGITEISLGFHQFDLLGHKYAEKTLGPISFESSEPGLLPIFELIQTKPQSKTPEPSHGKPEKHAPSR